MIKRRDAFYKTCLENNIHISQENIIYVNGSMEDGAQAGLELINNNKLTDAVFCDTDCIAQGLIYSLRKQNISVPDEVQVMAIGLANPEFSKFYSPSITVIDVPMEEMAAKCMKIITEVASHDLNTPSHTIYESVLHERDSTFKKTQ